MVKTTNHFFENIRFFNKFNQKLKPGGQKNFKIYLK